MSTRVNPHNNVENQSVQGWLSSHNLALALSFAAFLSFLGRAFADFRYEFALQDPEGQWTLLATLIYVVLSGSWAWALLAAQRGRKAGWVMLFVLNLLLNILFGIATLLWFCPPGCEPWPTGPEWNVSNIISGMLGASMSGVQLWSRNKSKL